MKEIIVLYLKTFGSLLILCAFVMLFSFMCTHKKTYNNLHKYSDYKKLNSMNNKEVIEFLIHAHNSMYVMYPEGASKKWHEEREVKSKGFCHAIEVLAEATLTLDMKKYLLGD